MTSFRLPINTPYVSWRDAQKVSLEDMADEQTHFLQTDATTVDTFFGSGIVLETPNINVIFNSDELTSIQQAYAVSNDFDGRGISPANQPTDTVLGNQLELILSDSDVSLRRTIKVCVIGTDFQNALQYETFSFNKNEIQIGKKHFKTIISLLFNDFLGNKNGSRVLGGTLIIQEAYGMELSRDEITASQNLEPNLFFRDFKCADQTIGTNPTTILSTTLQNALGTSGYTVDALNINTGYVDKKSLVVGDLSTRYGQKFQAKVNNIQKVRILLGVETFGVVPANWFDWSGDLIVSIHAIQTSVACPTDTIPNNAIDYQPNPSPIVQVILTQATLADAGIVLTNIAQPIDVIFTNTRVGGYVNTGITPDNYYVVTIQRAGDTTTGEIFTLTGRDYSSNSVFTEFGGSTWVDDPTIDMWFEIYSDALKVASGIGYDSGTGMSVDKTILDTSTGSTIDYSKDGLSFANNGQGVINYTVVQAVKDQIDPIQDSRTGNSVYSRTQSNAEVSTVISTQLSVLQESANPIILGCAFDINNKITTNLIFTQKYIGLANNNIFTIINPDPSLLLYNLVGNKFNPNTNNVDAYEYLIYKTQLCTDGYGDLNNDGYIGYDDLLRMNYLLGEDITTVSTQRKIIEGHFSTLEFLRADINGDGIIDSADIALVTDLYNKKSVTLPFGDSFTRLSLYLENKFGRNDGYFSSYDGYARMWDTTVPRQAQYGVDSLLPIGGATLVYYGFPVPVDGYVNEPAFSTLPYVANPFKITVKPNWFKEFIKTNYSARLMPCTFTDMTSTTVYDCSASSKTYCEDLDSNVSCDGGKNDLFVPDNLIIDKGQLLSKAGGYYAVDLEINSITLNLPSLPIADKSLDLFTLFVCESPAANGFTTIGYPAMKFADCSYIQNTALALKQIRFDVSIESLCINVDGYDISIGYDAYGSIADPLLGTHLDHETGILTLRGTNIYSDPDITYNCKILITVYIKKAGWRNTHLNVPENELTNLLGL